MNSLITIQLADHNFCSASDRRATVYIKSNCIFLFKSFQELSEIQRRGNTSNIFVSMRLEKLSYVRDDCAGIVMRCV